MLHWAMRSISHRRTAMAIKMTRNGGTFFVATAYFDCCNHSLGQGPCYGPLKSIASYIIVHEYVIDIDYSSYLIGRRR
jgi:hypothetical protein